MHASSLLGIAKIQDSYHSYQVLAFLAFLFMPVCYLSTEAHRFMDLNLTISLV